MMFSSPETDTSELELLRKIRSAGHPVGRSREVFDVSLSLVSDLMNGNPPRGGVAGRTLLAEFLEAELAPGLTVEQACYPSADLFERRVQPTPHQVAEARCLLRGAGLVYIEEEVFEPGYVKLKEPHKFGERFPHLKHVIPFVLHSEGVWVMSGATPVRHSKPKLVKT